MKQTSILLTALLLSLTVAAQGVITRIGSDGTHFYYSGIDDLQTVFDHATTLSQGLTDTIIFSGGTFLLTDDVVITSPVILIGSGSRSDSSDAYNGRTEFLSNGTTKNITLGPDADGTEMHGLTFSMNPGSVRLGDSFANSAIDNAKFYRCSFRYLSLGSGGVTSQATNTLIQECIINDQLDVHGSTNVLIRNSFLGDIYLATAGSNTVVRNCILIDWNSASNELVHYTNNIFLTNSNSVLNVAENAVYTHNLFVGGDGSSFNVTFNNGIVEDNTSHIQPLSGSGGAFPGTPAPSDYALYQPNRNYMVNSTLPLGNDGSPVGIYGGDAPWKNGSLPFNPHWTLLGTPANTVDGVLPNVHIKASAQEN